MKKISFQKREDIRRLYIKASEKFSLHTVFATFSFMGTLASRQKKNNVTLPEMIWIDPTDR